MILHRIRVAIALLCLLAWPPAYAQKTPAQIRTDINTLFPDNDQNRITPFDLRFVTTEITSAYLPVTSVIPSANIPPATNGGLGGVFAVACASNLWIQTITTGTGSPVCTQVNFSNLAGVASATQIAASPASHATPIDVAGTPTWSVVPNCLDSLGQHVNYTQSTDAWSCGTSTNAGPGVGSVDNLLPNSQWQAWTGVTFGIKLNAAGTGSQATVACTGFSTTNAAPTLTGCANTQTLRTNDLAILSIVPFWGFAGAGAGYIDCVKVNCTPGEQALGSYVTGVRIGAIVPNVSVNIPNPGFSGVSPTVSAAVNIVPIAPGDLAGTGTNGPTGWTKTSTLIATIDDWGAAATPSSTVYPGCERPLLLRKGATGNELFSAPIPAAMIKKFAGQTVTFGVAIYQRVQGNGNTGNIFIIDNAGSNFSANLTGVSFGGYQFATVTHTFASNMTSGSIGFQPNGLIGDVFDVCLPTAAFIPSMVQSQLHQNSYELISSRHWNPPLLDPFLITFPSSPLVAGLFGWNNIDLEAISFGTVHNTVQYVWGDLEWTSSDVTTPANPSTVFMGSNTANLNFGIKASTIVAGTTFSTSAAPMPLYTDGTFAMYTGKSGLVTTNGTADFWDIVISTGSWNN